MHLSNVNSTLSAPRSIRFRRWSRKGYAAFISVQRAVTIGQLTANISERFQQKNCSLHTVASLSGESLTVSDEKAYTPDEEDVCFSSLLITNVTSYRLATGALDAAAATDACYNKIYYTEREAVNYMLPAFRFFMPITK